MDWLYLCLLENKWLMTRVLQVCTQIWIFVRKAPSVCLWIVKGCIGGRTNHRAGWVGRYPWRFGICLCSTAQDDGTVGVRQAGALVRHQLPMVNGEFGLPETSLMRCPSEWLLKPCTNTMEIVPRDNSLLLSSGGGLFWWSPRSLFLSSTLLQMRCGRSSYSRPVSLKVCPLQTTEETDLALCIQQGAHLPNLIQTQEDCALRADNPNCPHTWKTYANKIILCVYTSFSTPQGLPS